MPKAPIPRRARAPSPSPPTPRAKKQPREAARLEAARLEAARLEAGRRAAQLLAWYDRHRRALPWRALPGEPADPYRVWLSEIMLQQTTVVAVQPYYRDFLARWPTVAALAAAPVEDVMAAWAGLGYYARARNLHACAKAVAAQGGAFPASEEGLRALPGVGAYTAAAVAAIAFGRRAVVVDGNVERVMARMFAVTEKLPGAKPALKALAASLTPAERAGDYAQAAMDLGATVCTPRKPRCMLCPWRADCAGRGEPERYPAKAAEKEKPLRSGAAFFVTRADGAIWLRRRPPSGLLGGMLEVPSSPWRDGEWRDAAWADARHAAPSGLDFSMLPGMVRHGFTHFALELKVFAARGFQVASDPLHGDPLHGEWWPVDRLGEAALPSLMRKVVAHGLKAPATTATSAPPAASGAARRSARAARRG